MERHFLSRKSAVALLVDARRALADQLSESSPNEAARIEQMLRTIERLLLDVRVGRTREFDMEYPTLVRIIVSD